MDREIIDYDPRIFGVRTSRWHIDTRGRGGNGGITGTGQVIYGRQPRWTTSLQMVPGAKGDLLGWRSIVARLRGRINVLRLHVGDPLRPRFEEVNPGYRGEPIPYDDGALHDDGSGFIQGMSAPILEDCAVGATSIRIDAGYLNNMLAGGHMFSIDDWLYQATMVTGTGPDAVVHFEMPLRRAVAAGVDLNLDARALMVLEGDLEGVLDLNEAGMAAPALSLSEWVGPGRS